MRRPILVCLLAMACATEGDSSGETEPTVSSTGSGSTTAPVTGGSADDSDTTGSASADGTTSSASVTTGSSGEPADSSTTSSGPQVPGDCRTLLEEEPTTPDGVHMLHAGGDPEGPTFDAWCDMTTDGGGLTLVGRSAPGDWGELPFGWYEATGDLANDDEPYSLDAASAQLQFTEVLIGSYADGKTWGNDAYILTVPENFVFVYAQAPHEPTVTTVIGSCMPRGGPHHLHVIGWTEEPGLFYFDDGLNFEEFDGLERNRIDTDHAGECPGGGNLHDEQGMMMVR